MDLTLTTAEIIDIELRLTGHSLARWAADQGLPLLSAVAMLEGFVEPRAEHLSSLADALGVSGRSLRDLLPQRGQTVHAAVERRPRGKSLPRGPRRAASAS